MASVLKHLQEAFGDTCSKQLLLVGACAAHFLMGGRGAAA